MEQTIKQKAQAIADIINNSPADVQRATVNFTHKDQEEQDQITDMVVKLAKKNSILSHPVPRKNGDMISSIIWGTDTKNVEEWECDGIPFEWTGAKDLQC